MATDNDNQIPQPKIDVTLLTTIKVKANNDITIKDIYNTILSSQDKFTSDVAEYSSQQTVVNSKNEVGKSPKIPKFLVGLNDFGPSLTLLGSALICTPYTPWFNSSGCARLKQDTFYSGGVKNQINGQKVDGGTAVKANKSYTFTNTDGSTYTTTAKNGNDAGAALSAKGWGWYTPVADSAGKFSRDSKGNIKYAMVNSTNANPFANLSAGWNFSTSRETLNPFYGYRQTQSYVNEYTGEPGGVWFVDGSGNLVAPNSITGSTGQATGGLNSSITADTKIGSNGASFADNANSVGGFVGNTQSPGAKSQNSNSVAPVVGPGNPIKIGNSSMGLPQTGATDVLYPNTWYCSAGGWFAEAGNNSGITLINKDTSKSPTIKSNFQILDKQPFAFKFSLGDFNPYQRAEIESNLKSKDDVVEALIPRVQIIWDKYTLIFKKDGKITLNVEGKEVGKGQLPTVSIEEKSGDRGKQITVYPLGNSLFVYSGDVTTEATVKKAFIRFNLKEPYKIRPTFLSLSFTAGESTFDYSIVIHPTDGVLKSPYFSSDFTPDTKIVNLGYLWKVGSGARPSPINFPEANDTNGHSNYLSRHKIIYSVDSVGQNKFAYTLTLKQPNQLGTLAALTAFAEKVSQNTISEFNKVLSGTQSLNQGLANSLNYAGANEPSDGFFTDNSVDYAQDISDSWDKMVLNLANSVLSRDFGDDSAAATQALQNAGYGSTAKTITGNVSSILGANSYSSIKASKLNYIRKSVDKIATNIYSPAVYFINVTLHQNLVTASLNPNPQIDPCDVLNISINQAVERQSGTIVLNNRQSCESNPTQGKYTHTSSNNFTGIKPIQVKMGYTDGPLNTVFTGYITKYKYDRNSPQSSTCTLELEDVSKKCKEQYAVNLPFFDGWCLGQNSKILTTNGLETIKDLANKGSSFSIVTSYEDKSKITVKGCIAFKSGCKELYKIVLRNGLELESTLDHKFLKFNTDKPPYANNFYKSEWYKLKDLSVGDRIKVNEEIAREFIFDKEEDCSMDELLGWWVGDGYYNINDNCDERAMGIVFGPYDMQAFNHLVPTWNNLLNSCGTQTKPQIDENKVTICATSHKNVAAFLKSKGFKTATARVKTLPDYIWTASVKQQCAFLRGLFSSDGTVYGGHKVKNRISLASNSRQLIKDVQLLLSSLGISSNIIDKPYSNYKPQKDRVNPRLDGYALDICGESSIRYMKYIGFLLDRKTNKWESPLCANKPKDFVEIVSIERVGEQDVYDISMPEVHAFYANGIYAHNCHIAAMYYLLRECGFDDSEMRLYTNGPTLRSLLQGDPDTFTGGCFEGHIGGRPAGSGGLSGSYVHQRLPMAFVGVTQPVFNFQFGAEMWSCMQRIRNHSGWFLYGDVNGHIIYGPPKSIITDAGVTFKETSQLADLFEIQRNLDVVNDTTNNRNAVFVQGQTFLPNLDITQNNWGAHIHILKSPTFYNEVNKPNYAPYIKMSFERNPKFEDPSATSAYAAETYRRATREWKQANFGAWGHPELLPYQQLNIEEAVNETGSTGKWVIAAHNISLDVSNMQMLSQFNCENMDQTSINFDPQSSANRRQ